MDQVLINATKSAMALQQANATKAMGISKSLFSTAPTTGGGDVSKAGMTTRPYIYYLPDNTTLVDKTSFFWYLVLCSRRQLDVKMLEVQSWLATLVYLLYPTVLDSSTATHYVKTPFGRGNLEKVGDMMTAAKGESLSNPDAKHWTPVNIKSFGTSYIPKLGLTDFPKPSVISPLAMNVELEPLMMYAYLGVICFSFNKDIAGSGKQALETKRFDALKKKYKWTDLQAPVLSEEARPSNEFFSVLSSAWGRMPHLRREFFTYAAHISTFNSNAEDEALFTVVRLMKWSDLAHITIINTLIAQYPWVLSLPSLATAAQAYAAGLNQLRQMCPIKTDAFGREEKDEDGSVVRDTTLMPYVKVVYGDKLDVARRDQMLPLIFLAVEILKPSLVSLAQYTVGSVYPVVMREFRYIDTSIQAADPSQQAVQGPGAANPGAGQAAP